MPHPLFLPSSLGPLLPLTIESHQIATPSSDTIQRLIPFHRQRLISHRSPSYLSFATLAASPKPWKFGSTKLDLPNTQHCVVHAVFSATPPDLDDPESDVVRPSSTSSADMRHNLPAVSSCHSAPSHSCFRTSSGFEHQDHESRSTFGAVRDTDLNIPYQKDFAGHIIVIGLNLSTTASNKTLLSKAPPQ